MRQGFSAPCVDRIPPGSWPIPSGSCHETCTRPRREANFTSMGSVGSRQDPGQSRQDPATKHAPGLGEKQISLPRVDRILPGSWPIPSGSCHETCTRPRRDANFTSIRRRRSRRILHAIPPQEKSTLQASDRLLFILLNKRRGEPLQAHGAPPRDAWPPCAPCFVFYLVL